MQTAIEANKFAKDEIIGVSEHKITNEERIAQIQNGLAGRGLKAHFTKANKTTKEGASAGVALLWKAWLDVSEVGEAFDEARAVSPGLEAPYHRPNSDSSDLRHKRQRD